VVQQVSNELNAEAEQLVKAALDGDMNSIREIGDALDGDIPEDAEDDLVPTTRPEEVLQFFRGEGESLEHAIANNTLRPTLLAAVAERSLLKYGSGIPLENLTLNALAEVLQEQARAVTKHNLERGEGMLAAQAHTLDAMFNVLTRKALQQNHAPYIEMFLRIALRAQAQCRATWEAISAIQNPPIAGYVAQANVATNQQVNNGTAPPSRARENETSPSKLLEQAPHEADEWLDSRASATATGSDSAVEALVGVDRATDSGGESDGRA
jgi:hypothetical protein